MAKFMGNSRNNNVNSICPGADSSNFVRHKAYIHGVARIVNGKSVKLAVFHSKGTDLFDPKDNPCIEVYDDGFCVETKREHVFYPYSEVQCVDICKEME